MNKKILATILLLVATLAFAADKYISSSGDIVLKTATAKKVNLNDTLYTTQAGYVQVGTTATQSKVNIGPGSLWINANTTGDGIQFDIPGSGTPGKDYQIANTGVSDTMTFGGTGVSAATKIYHNVSSGNVGIGGAPSERLEVTRSDAGIIQKWNDSMHDSVALSISGAEAKFYTLSTTKLSFGTHGNADPVSMSILDGGKVDFSTGIGFAGAASTLDTYRAETLTSCLVDNAGNKSSNVSVYITKIGSIVTMTIPAVTMATSTSTDRFLTQNCSSAPYTPSQMPSWAFGGATEKYIPITVCNNGAYTTGVVAIGNSTVTRIWTTVARGNWTSGAVTTGLCDGTSATWSIY